MDLSGFVGDAQTAYKAMSDRGRARIQKAVFSEGLASAFRIGSAKAFAGGDLALGKALLVRAIRTWPWIVARDYRGESAQLLWLWPR